MCEARCQAGTEMECADLQDDDSGSASRRSPSLEAVGILAVRSVLTMGEVVQRAGRLFSFYKSKLPSAWLFLTHRSGVWPWLRARWRGRRSRPLRKGRTILGRGLKSVKGAQRNRIAHL